MRLDKFTSRLQQALADAQSLAVGRDHNMLEPLHVMAALLDQQGGSTVPLLSQAQVNVPLLRQRVGESLARLPQVKGQEGQVNVSTTADRVEPGEQVKLSAEVLDPAYVEVNDSRVVAHIKSPSGKTSEVPVDWTVTRDGDYRATFVPDETGIYNIDVVAERADKQLYQAKRQGRNRVSA